MDLKQELLRLEWRELKYRDVQSGYHISENGILVHNVLGFIDPHFSWNSKRLQYTLKKKDGSFSFIEIQMLVANHFLVRPFVKGIKFNIDHIDDNKFNNHYSNLKYIPVDINSEKGRLKEALLTPEVKIKKKGKTMVIKFLNQLIKGKNSKNAWRWVDYYKSVLLEPYTLYAC